jgi:hypothetical protein
MLEFASNSDERKLQPHYRVPSQLEDQVILAIELAHQSTGPLMAPSTLLLLYGSEQMTCETRPHDCV